MGIEEGLEVRSIGECCSCTLISGGSFTRYSLMLWSVVCILPHGSHDPHRGTPKSRGGRVGNRHRISATNWFEARDQSFPTAQPPPTRSQHKRSPLLSLIASCSSSFPILLSSIHLHEQVVCPARLPMQQARKHFPAVHSGAVAGLQSAVFVDDNIGSMKSPACQLDI
jgi:hypothetical protein